MAERPGRLGVGIIGAGRVGAVLGSALRATGHAVVGVSGTSDASRERAETMLPGVPVLPVEDVVERSELVLFAVPDDTLEDLVSGLATRRRFVAGQLVVHTAGRYGISVLAPAMQQGAIPLAIHPAMTFTGTSMDLGRLIGAPFAVTAAAPVLPVAQALVVEMGGEPVVLPEDSRGLYHAALAHGGNHLVTVISQAIRVLVAAGIEDGGALLRPLLTAALDGALREGDAALTGPVARGDAGTVAEHVHTLAKLGPRSSDVLDAYLALARATTQRALATGRLRADQADALLDALAGPAAGNASQTETSPTPPEPDPTRPEPDPTRPEPSAVPPESRPAEPEPGAGAAPTRVPHPRAGATSSAIPVARTRTELRRQLEQGRSGLDRAAVFTMGALHAGHLSLVRKARELADQVVVSIFVNPLQFNQREDLDSYPSSLQADLDVLAELGGVDVVFAPSVPEMYPGGEPQVRVRPGELGSRLEGASRPGHFEGVLTVVHKLLSLTAPQISVFGQKDAQQLVLVRQMVRDLDIGTRIVSAPTVREPDGLALSSRNVHLSESERGQALTLVRALRAGREVAERGGSAEEVIAAGHAAFQGADPQVVALDYLELVDADSMDSLPGPGEPGLLVVAARVGQVRLIDNTEIHVRP